MLENGDSVSLEPPPYAIDRALIPGNRVWTGTVPLDSWSEATLTLSLQRTSKQQEDGFGIISYFPAGTTFPEGRRFRDLVTKKPLSELNLFNVENRVDPLVSTAPFSKVRVDPDFTKPVLTNLSFQASTHSHQYPIAEETETLIRPLSQVWQLPGDVLNLCPNDSVNRISVFDQSKTLYSGHPNTMTDHTTLFGSIDTFHLQPIATISITLTDNSVPANATAESAKALRAQFRQFVATCAKDLTSSESRRYPNSAKYSQSNSTSSNVAMVHTAAKCRKC